MGPRRKHKLIDIQPFSTLL